MHDLLKLVQHIKAKVNEKIPMNYGISNLSIMSLRYTIDELIEKLKTTGLSDVHVLASTPVIDQIQEILDILESISVPIPDDEIDRIQMYLDAISQEIDDGIDASRRQSDQNGGRKKSKNRKRKDKTTKYRYRKKSNKRRTRVRVRK